MVLLIYHDLYCSLRLADRAPTESNQRPRPPGRAGLIDKGGRWRWRCWMLGAACPGSRTGAAARAKSGLASADQPTYLRTNCQIPPQSHSNPPPRLRPPNVCSRSLSLLSTFPKGRDPIDCDTLGWCRLFLWRLATPTSTKLASLSLRQWPSRCNTAGSQLCRNFTQPSD